MNTFIIVSIVIGGFFLMVLGSNSSKNKKNGNRRGGRDREFDVDVKKLDSVTKRMEMLHQEQEISRVTNRFASSGDTAGRPPTIRLNRNF